ncbi:hypothetical protein PsorP6_003497 [Peronosclerospora sorghi]|uniref:Uncharacterized protein n=1 Tax=Peronosclerospora sorghi TaxID=230839 RepID=A0ACC0VPH4_9STRA|nr:hypothetical protein PsorP6_003497 [Peronosclerospora sorghi]
MSWLQTHEVAIPFYEVRSDKQVFAIQIHELAQNWCSITSTGSRHNFSGDQNVVTGNTLGVRITVMRSYSQFRKLWRDLISATKTPSSATFSCYNITRPTHAAHSSKRLLANSFDSLPASGGEYSPSCRCRNCNCAFHSFHYFLKNYPFPPKFMLKRSSPTALEIRRQKLELFIATVRGLFDTLSHSFLRSIEALETCQVLTALNMFFGFNESEHVNSMPRKTLQLPSAGKATECCRSNSEASESTTCFSTGSQSGISNCSAGKTTTTEKSPRKSLSTKVESHEVKFDATHHRNIEIDRRIPPSSLSSINVNAMCDDKKTPLMNRASAMFMKKHRRGSRYTSGIDIRHPVFLTYSPTTTAHTCSETSDSKIPRTLLPGFPTLISTSRNKRSSMQLFLNEFQDLLLMDSHALENCNTHIGNADEKGKWELALYSASQIGHEQAVESILKRGTNPNAVMADGFSSLQAACRGGHRNIVAMLLTHGADTNMANPKGVTPLFFAIQFGDIEIVEMLVECGANVNLCNTDSVSAVHVAVACEMLSMLELLLGCNAFVNTKNDFNGKTPLHLAAQIGSLPMCKLLLDHGGCIHHKTARGFDVVDLAKSHGHKKIVKYCLKFDKKKKNIQRKATRMTRTTFADYTTGCCSHEVTIVAEDGYAYAVL